MNRRLLMIAYHYPPAKGSSGIQRTLKFSAYLRDLGWEPIVLTVSPRAYSQTSDDQMAEIPAGAVVARAFAFNAAKTLALAGRYPGWLAQPDRWVSWWPAGVWQGLGLIRRYRPAAIFSTFPIATAHLIALTLRRLSGLPWLADCRDSMTEPGYPPDPLTWKTNRRLEAAMVRHCSRAIFTTPGARRMYAERYPEIDPSRWAVIENAFDEDNFRAAEQVFEAPPAQPDKPVTLVHSGILYPAERDPRPFFSALAKLKAAGEIGSASLQVVLRAAGNEAEYRTMLQELGLTDIVHLPSPVSYREALQEMLGADGLLLFQGASCNHQIPAKLYEYFRAGRPILALADPAGDTANALRAASAQTIADIANEEDIVGALRTFLAGVRGGTLAGVAREAAARHSRQSRTRELAALLDEVLAEAGQTAAVGGAAGSR